MLFWTGGLFPFSYGELLPETTKVERLVATSIFIPNPPVRGLVLPMTAELERASVGRSYWGKVERAPLATPLDGTRVFDRVLDLFGKAGEATEAPLKLATVSDVVKMAGSATAATRAVGDLLLVGEKKAIGLRGFHDPENEVSISHADAARVGVSGRNYLRVKSPTAEREFRVNLTDAVPAGVLMVGTNVHSNRCLFPLADDALTGEVTVPPVRVTIEKTERVPVAGGENLSVWS
jgi:hypothetical protein